MATKKSVVFSACISTVLGSSSDDIVNVVFVLGITLKKELDELGNVQSRAAWLFKFELNLEKKRLRVEMFPGILRANAWKGEIRC